MISTDLFPTVSLTEIFRQEETSDIVVAAHAVHRGEIPLCGRGKDSDFIFLDMASEEDILKTLVSLVSKLYEKRGNFQVLSPRHAGTLGVTNLNQHLREALNPKTLGLSEMRLGSEVVREGDRVMVVKNNYDLGIFNGDVGKISRLDRKASEVILKLHGPPVLQIQIPFRTASTYLRLAYCMTVHKSQGQEYDIIVLPVVNSYGHQLQRNLFYTAITRARKRVILLGHRPAMAQAVFNNKEDVRNTLFPERLDLAFAGDSVVASTG
jgi:exodeoxyribonuclease V alpha subunit